jgi:pyruvate formate lyase activating enzyme
MQGFIFDIKRYAVNDGPGIRTTVFFKGCNLRCRWCHNPESQSSRHEEMTVKRKLGDNTFDDVQQVGYLIESGKLVDQLARDEVFFDESGGGVTFSGGEPLLQPEFLLECLKGCKTRNISTCVDTAGAVSTSLLEEIISQTDIFLFDVKTMNPDKFSEFIGNGFSLVADNLAKVAQQARRVIIRIPVIPGVNDDEDGITQIIDVLSQYPRIKEVSLLPFHRTGADKYRRLGRKWMMGETHNLSREDLLPINERFLDAGFQLFST